MSVRRAGNCSANTCFCLSIIRPTQRSGLFLSLSCFAAYRPFISFELLLTVASADSIFGFVGQRSRSGFTRAG